MLLNGTRLTSSMAKHQGKIETLAKILSRGRQFMQDLSDVLQEDLSAWFCDCYSACMRVDAEQAISVIVQDVQRLLPPLYVSVVYVPKLGWNCMIMKSSKRPRVMMPRPRLPCRQRCARCRCMKQHMLESPTLNALPSWLERPWAHAQRCSKDARHILLCYSARPTLPAKVLALEFVGSAEGKSRGIGHHE